MTRTTRAFHRGLVAALAVVAAAVGPLPQLAHAGTGSVSAEVLIPSQTTTGPVGLAMVADDADGYVLEGTGTYQMNNVNTKQYTWHSADGTVTRDLGRLPHAPVVVPLPGGGSAVGTVQHGTAGQSPTRIGIYDVRSGTWTYFDVPSGHVVVGIVPTATGWAAITQTSAATGDILHLLTPAAGGDLTDTVVSGVPAGGFDLTNVYSQWQAVRGTVAFLTRHGTDAQQIGLIDTDTGALTFLQPSGGSTSTQLLLSDGVFGTYDASAAKATVRAISTPRTVVADIAATYPGGGPVVAALAGRALILGRANAGLMWRQTASPVESFPLDGSAPTVLTQMGSPPAETADGGVTFDAATGSGGWATYKLPAQGGPATVVRDYTTYRPEYLGLSLDRGELSRVEAGPDFDVREHLENADLGTSATPKLAGRVEERERMPWDAVVNRCDGLRCEALTDTDTGSSTLTGAAPVYLSTNLLGKDVLGQEGGNGNVTLDTSQGRITSADGTLAVYDSAANGQQYLVDLATRQVVRTRPTVAAALWNGTLWSATATPGTFTTESTTALGATPGTVTSVSTDVPCVPDEIQVLGRWLYWSCGADGPAGVFDSTRGHSVAVPAGKALLGDGFVLQHTGGHLVLTDVHTGTAAGRTLADLPAGAYADDRGITWTVDKYRGFVAYTDTAGTTHVLPSGVPASPLAVLRGTVGTTATPDATGWQGQWTFTGPVSSWQVDVRRRGQTGVVASFHGGAARASASVHWSVRYGSSLPMPDGDYTWSLTAVPADGAGPALSTTGTITVSGTGVHARDYSGDGVGDLLALTSAGRLDVRPGTGSAPGGVRTTSASGSGWPSTSRLVPFGDLNGDGANDLLVRDATGHLTVYYGTAAHTFTPAGPHRLIGAGWNIYDVLTWPGDANSDGRPDLIARDSAGSLYLYGANGSGAFAPRTKAGYGYQIYDTIVGVQDLYLSPQFPAAGGLLARDRSGVLWQYQTIGGRVCSRARVGGGWNTYNMIVGVGDINGDGRNDVVARDGNGGLWRYDGRTYGGFQPRVEIGWGWQSYKSLI
ncbi:VCBS repeat-containing protein [Streptomyces sp. NPDC051976]|uniref:VCBS repeat-containing protein n=1 Tax=Streptomyces sp. NPDC051976 TaxID=3154947 RepID=UPI00342E2A3A